MKSGSSREWLDGWTETIAKMPKSKSDRAPRATENQVAEAAIQFTVLGEAAPQGSKRPLGNGRMIESSERLKPWRDSVSWAAWEARVGRRFVGPVEAVITFGMRKPKKPKFAEPASRPDVDKLQRAVFDALTQSGIIGDDGQITKVTAQKVYMAEPKTVVTLAGTVASEGRKEGNTSCG